MAMGDHFIHEHFFLNTEDVPRPTQLNFLKTEDVPRPTQLNLHNSPTGEREKNLLKKKKPQQQWSPDQPLPIGDISVFDVGLNIPIDEDMGVEFPFGADESSQEGGISERKVGIAVWWTAVLQFGLLYLHCAGSLSSSRILHPLDHSRTAKLPSRMSLGNFENEYGPTFWKRV